MRQEGKNWNAYYALAGTMDNAIFLSSINLGIVTAYPERKLAFMGLMRDVVADIVEHACGVRPIWDNPQDAPEHECAGNA